MRHVEGFKHDSGDHRFELSPFWLQQWALRLLESAPTKSHNRDGRRRLVTSQLRGTPS
jgi:hypothetical protein